MVKAKLSLNALSEKTVVLTELKNTITKLHKRRVMVLNFLIFIDYSLFAMMKIKAKNDLKTGRNDEVIFKI